MFTKALAMTVLAGSLAAVTGGGTALAATPRAATTIVAKAAQASVTAGTTDTFTTTLKTGSKPVAGAIVKLREEKAGSKTYSYVASAVTNSSGIATFKVTVVKGNDHFQAVYLGNSKRLPSHSGVIAVLGK